MTPEQFASVLRLSVAIVVLSGDCLVISFVVSYVYAAWKEHSQ